MSEKKETFSNNWLNSNELPDELKEAFSASALPEDQKELLLSEGSLTLHLERIFGSPVEVEVSRTVYSPLSPDEASYLDESPCEESMIREVWLRVGGKRLVYARTLIPLARMERGLMEVLKQGGEPLGKILSTKNIPFTKDRLEVGVIKNERAAKELGIDPERPLFARRYRLLSMKEEGRWNIKASVTEVFSPELVGANQ
jgi:chorismate-pyruvate lyase